MQPAERYVAPRARSVVLSPDISDIRLLFSAAVASQAQPTEASKCHSVLFKLISD